MKTFSTQDGNDVRKDARRVTMSIPKRTRRARARCLFIGVWFLTWWRHSRASPVSLDNSFPFSLSSLRLSDSNELVSLKKKKNASSSCSRYMNMSHSSWNWFLPDPIHSTKSPLFLYTDFFSLPLVVAYPIWIIDSWFLNQDVGNIFIL